MSERIVSFRGESSAGDDAGVGARTALRDGSLKGAGSHVLQALGRLGLELAGWGNRVEGTEVRGTVVGDGDMSRVLHESVPLQEDLSP